MKYLPLTDADAQRILEAAGAKSFEELIEGIPEELRTQQDYDLPGPYDELGLMRDFQGLESSGRHVRRTQCFLGGGCYAHFIPAAVDQLATRGEFLTAYTPYQPEVSQGTLQAGFEFQSYVCLLTGMEVANASMYDGATALTEAVLMARRLGRKMNRVVVSRAIHPEYLQTLRSLTAHLEIDIQEIGFGEGGTTDLEALAEAIDADTFAVAVQSPNALGMIEPLGEIEKLVRAQPKCLHIVAVAEALSLGLVKPPGEYGADIVAGEGQSWGLPMGFGGPHLGWFAVREKTVRQMPGRLVGMTSDERGNRAFTLTLSTREQHIRREKATSNICTNQGLMALRAAIFLSLLGKNGLGQVARANYAGTHYAMKRLGELSGVEIIGDAKRFNEIAFKLPTPVHKGKAIAFFQEAGMLGGLDLERWYPELDRHLLSAFTEIHGTEHIDQWIGVLEKALI